jgi:hypothetical protein
LRVCATAGMAAMASASTEAENFMENIENSWVISGGS